MNWMIVTSYDQRPILYKTMCDQTGVDIRNNMTAKKLVTNSDGAVTGVIALSDDNVATQFNAKAVVIATGGYAGNDNMVKEAFGRSPLCGGLPQNIGEGLEMCWAIGGAKPRNYGMQMPHQTYVSASKRLASDYDDLKAKYPFLAAYAPCFLNTTAKGRRFRNEANLYNADAAANSDMYQGDYHWTIVSASQLATLETSGLAALGVDEKLTISPIQAPTYNLDTPWVDATTVFNKMVENGDGYKGSDAKSLAKAAGMDPEIFQNELEKYEKSCSTGQDYVCGKDSKYLAAYGSGDLYAIYTSVNNLTSCGGVTVDTDFNVLDSSENKIDGLYAIGVECLSNLFSDTYTGVGAALVTSYTSGYLVAETLLNA
jgi:fumarate reductase flavoprotein subunit